MEKVFESNYLNKKLEPERSQKFGNEQNNESLKKLKVPFIEHDYSKKSGFFEAKIGETKIFLEYSNANFLDKNEILGLLLKDLVSSGNKLGSTDPFSNLRQLKEFTLEKGKDRLDIKDIFPEGEIYFNFGEPLDKTSSRIVGNETILITCDPLTPAGLLDLTHEVGHFQEFVSLVNGPEIPVSEDEDMYDINMHIPTRGYVEQPDEAEIKSERTAWAFALNNIRPFIKDLSIDIKDIKQYVHDECLQSYSDFIREK